MAYQGLSGAPTVFPTSGSTGGSTKRRAARSARPCAYGERMANGRCPPKRRKPRAARAKKPKFADVVDLPTPPPREKPRKKTKARARAERRLETIAVSATNRQLRKGIARAASSSAGQKAIGAGAKAAAYLGTNVGALTGAAAAGAVGLAIAAGTASFLATSYVLKKIRDRKEQRQQAAFEASQALRRARAEAVQRLGRPLTPAENQRMAKAFDLDALINKAGIISER